jgi:hypothetical protein
MSYQKLVTEAPQLIRPVLTIDDEYPIEGVLTDADFRDRKKILKTIQASSHLHEPGKKL